MSRKDSTVAEREQERRHNRLVLKCIIAFLILAMVLMTALLIYETGFRKSENPFAEQVRQQESERKAQKAQEEAKTKTEDGVMAKASLLAAQYDYDGAISLLQSQEDYESTDRYRQAVRNYQQLKGTCQAYPVDQITHVFFHSLIADDAKAFDGDEDSAGYNQVMTTLSEFQSIISQMYSRGYVMVSLHDMCEVADDGTVSKKEILLPPGKTPFVLSQDDCSYYHYMDDDGFPQKLVLDADGNVKNSYRKDDGTVQLGDYDVVPVIDSFVREHPDFSYHGHKGILALTGYEGVLGYRTDEVYRTRDPERVTKWQQKFFDENPDFDYEKECAQARQVADAMKAEGWEFASHTWGHISPLEHSLDEVKTDTERWENNVAPIVGDTDVLIFAFGADIGDWQPYDRSENEYFDYYRSQGFSIYCNVDGSQKYWVQFGADYMRQGRRNLDGYRMYYNPDLLSDLFDVDKAWDSNRPTPVPEM